MRDGHVQYVKTPYKKEIRVIDAPEPTPLKPDGRKARKYAKYPPRAQLRAAAAAASE